LAVIGGGSVGEPGPAGFWGTVIQYYYTYLLNQMQFKAERRSLINARQKLHDELGLFKHTQCHAASCR